MEKAGLEMIQNLSGELTEIRKAQELHSQSLTLLLSQLDVVQKENVVLKGMLDKISNAPAGTKPVTKAGNGDLFAGGSNADKPNETQVLKSKIMEAARLGKISSIEAAHFDLTGEVTDEMKVKIGGLN
jgi:hypothetical protein